MSTFCLVVFIDLCLFIFHFFVKWFNFLSEFSILLCILFVIPYTHVLVDVGTYWKSVALSELEIRLIMQFILSYYIICILLTSYSYGDSFMEIFVISFYLLVFSRLLFEMNAYVVLFCIKNKKIQSLFKVFLIGRL